MTAPTTTYAEFTAARPVRARLRDAARDAALRLMALGRRIDAGGNWIRFPYYHHVFDDERRGFARQIDYLRQFGEFISLDDVVTLLESGDAIDGRYFCVTFDDGFKSCRTGATPILAERGVPAAFFLVTGLVGRSLAPDDAIARNVFGFGGRATTLDFLSWGECRDMIRAGMTFGSHTSSHARLSTLDDAAAQAELAGSKAAIEGELDTACDHFCAPYGIPGRDFEPARDSARVRDAGYRSLATGTRGPNRSGDDAFAIRRDHVLAGWGTHQLRYFLSLP